MKKYVRIAQGKVDNIYETNNPITEEFPADQLWVEVTANTQVDYSWNAVNTDGVWAFSFDFPWQPSPLSEQLRYEKTKRLDKANARLTATALPFKIELGIATPADEAYLLAHKQFCIALSNVNKQPGFPVTINWPELA
ncbi:tail fiber assembly protein [Pseudomonas sp. H3(2019)]|uniref:tail fiber assembly protein n=1 Tax=Pseudomonas sp. H3(2019) TaxID=2598724 RepID=UPI001195617A|nr:tail fiber assembly protein [Pseudomonas sp. H3(2019)]TVT82392.1 tail fiber assembly protein [Pseudomonas sp. H3(2019)]